MNISTRASDSWRRCRKRNYAMSIKRLFDAVERRGDTGRRIAALVLPISYRPRVTSSCAGKIGLREPGEHTSGPNLASRDNVAHNQNLYTILETRPPVISLCQKRARTYAMDGHMLFGVPRMLAESCRRLLCNCSLTSSLRRYASYVSGRDAYGASDAAAVFAPSISPSGFYLALRATPWSTCEPLHTLCWNWRSNRARSKLFGAWMMS